MIEQSYFLILQPEDGKYIENDNGNQNDRESEIRQIESNPHMNQLYCDNHPFECGKGQKDLPESDNPGFSNEQSQ